MTNPFRNWTVEDVQRHNERITHNENRSETQSPKPERSVQHEPVATQEGKTGDSSRVHVRVISRRTRLIDPDNLCPKYFVDCLRYAELIKDDDAQAITLEVSQEKVAKGSEETVIELDYATTKEKGPQ